MSTSIKNTDPAGVHGESWGREALTSSREERRAQQARVAAKRELWIKRNRYYYDSLIRLFRFIVEPGKRVLNVRCQAGHLLDALRPAQGLGVEISREMVDIARGNYAQYRFLCSDPESIDLHETFDYILFNDVSDTVDVLAAFQCLIPLCEPHTRLVIYNYNPLWQPVLEAGAALGLRMPLLDPNWLSEGDMKSMLRLSGFECLKTYRALLVPKWIPFLSWFCNRFLDRLPGISRLCMVYVMVARVKPEPRGPDGISVSVVIPCKNERDNVEPAVQRIPAMGRHTEIIFCDDKSTDGTGEEVHRMQKLHPDRDIRLIEGPGINKAENVWTGFRTAKGDALMILDGDLTVMPEELPYFFQALVAGRGEFINGSRLVYPVRKNAMKFANFIGNKFFSILFSYLLNQQIKDTLCGTKVLWRRDWERIEPLLGSWGIKDNWGDYELLFGAAKLHLRIVDLPVHYQERIYGATKMTRVFWNGMNMLRMAAAALFKLKGGY